MAMLEKQAETQAPPETTARVRPAQAFDIIAALPRHRHHKMEFLDGEMFIIMPDAPQSSEYASLINAALVLMVYPNDLGHVTGEQAGYMIGEERVSPDVAFIRKDKRFAETGYNPDPPDFVVEVISPSDRRRAIERKKKIYADAGIRAWFVYPKRREVEVYAPGQPVRIVGVDGLLDGGEVLPDFKLPVKTFFRG
ncbi:MAG: Uma2 family endonuclease [Chloroflexota bacterium]|nr:Uma2 family endonuclease [Chloroflexota bacterium]